MNNYDGHSLVMVFLTSMTSAKPLYQRLGHSGHGGHRFFEQIALDMKTRRLAIQRKNTYLFTTYLFTMTTMTTMTRSIIAKVSAVIANECHYDYHDRTTQQMRSSVLDFSNASYCGDKMKVLAAPVGLNIKIKGKTYG